MNRRTFLSVLSTGTVTGIAGCAELPFSDSSGSVSSQDSDLDGVPDEDDYAPWDDSVQNKSDVLTEYWGTPISPEDDILGESPTQSMFTHDSPPTVQSIRISPGETSPNSMSTIVEYSAESVTVRLHSTDVPDTSFRILVVAREFPRRGIQAVGQSPNMATSETDIEVSLDSKLDAGKTLYISAFITPDNILGEFDLTDTSYLHETNPFQVTENGVQTVDTEFELENLSSDRHTRISVEGGYVVALKGRTNGRDWSVSYFASRSAYERKRIEPRGRRREEFARYALSSGTGKRFIDVILHAATNAVISTRQEQAEFAIDIVQSIPYVSDSVGTGWDDYTKFIEETMVDVRGDCEDTTVALAILLDGLGYNVVLVEFPNHIGVGIAGDYEGSYISYENTQYYYIETTSEGWAIGDLPGDVDASVERISTI